jgi:hypothetical protein
MTDYTSVAVTLRNQPTDYFEGADEVGFINGFLIIQIGREQHHFSVAEITHFSFVGPEEPEEVVPPTLTIVN